MARRSRYHIAHVAQHVQQRGHNRQPAFFCDEDFRFYLTCLQEAAVSHACAVHAYALTRHEVQLLLTPREAWGVAKLMQSIGRSYVQYVNAKYRRSGTLWEGRYRACLVDQQHILPCSQYIEWNPVHTGLAKHPPSYPWSSCGAHTNGQRDQLLTPHPRYLALGVSTKLRAVAYRRLLARQLDSPVMQQIERAIRCCGLLGDEAFVRSVELALERNLRPRRPGRPKKATTHTTPESPRWQHQP